MKAMFRALRFMKDDPTAAAELTAKRLGWSPDAVLGAHKISSPLFPHDGTISVEALGSIQDTLLEYGILKRKLPLEEHISKEFTPVRL
jgi:hypothetical protein